MSNLISITGHLGHDSELKYVNNGSAVLELSIADTPRKKTDQGWEDAGPTVWFRASVWGPQAEAIANAKLAIKGALVDVTGTLTVREFEHNGEKRTSHDVRVDTIGIREKRGTTSGESFTPAAPAQGGYTDTPPF